MFGARNMAFEVEFLRNVLESLLWIPPTAELHCRSSIPALQGKQWFHTVKVIVSCVGNFRPAQDAWELSQNIKSNKKFPNLSSWMFRMNKCWKQNMQLKDHHEIPICVAIT